MGPNLWILGLGNIQLAESNIFLVNNYTEYLK